jgi:hypothetical protein
LAHTHDLKFISKQFEYFELPKEKKYLLKYFDTVLQETFLKYVFVFGDYKNFTDHTGFYIRPRWQKVLYNKLIRLEAAQKEARKNMDMQLLAKIETGKFKL